MPKGQPPLASIYGRIATMYNLVPENAVVIAEYAIGNCFDIIVKDNDTVKAFPHLEFKSLCGVVEDEEHTPVVVRFQQQMWGLDYSPRKIAEYLKEYVSSQINEDVKVETILVGVEDKQEDIDIRLGMEELVAFWNIQFIVKYEIGEFQHLRFFKAEDTFMVDEAQMYNIKPYFYDLVANDWKV